MRGDDARRARQHVEAADAAATGAAAGGVSEVIDTRLKAAVHRQRLQAQVREREDAMQAAVDADDFDLAEQIQAELDALTDAIAALPS